MITPTNMIEWIWERKTGNQILDAINVCLFRSANSKTVWAKKHWYTVARQLEDKYIGDYNV